MNTTLRAHRDPGAITGSLTGITFVSAIVGAMKLAKNPIPRPGAPAADVRTYYRDSARAVRFSATGQLVSIGLLARFTASVAQLAARSDRSAGALRTGAVLSGAAAVASLTASAVTHAALTVPRERDDASMVRQARRVFVAGGPVHGVAYGVLTGILATAGERTGVLNRPVAVTGLVSAAAGVLSPLYFRWESAGWLIPIGRFSGYIVSAIAGARLASAPRQCCSG
jgi:hypothetical protein